MDTIIDYVAWIGEFTFDVKAFCDEDALVLSSLSYFEFKLPQNDPSAPLTLRETYRRICEDRRTPPSFTARSAAPVYDFLESVAQSARYGDLLIRDYTEILDHEHAVQFSAVAFEKKQDFRFIAFRGTDDTLAGWKEDFMISFTRTAAQEMALDYTKEHIAPELRNFIGGHSKGANLALYAAAHLRFDLWDHVEQVYILDGPGFCKEVLDTSTIENVNRRATRIIPKYCVIGALFAPKISRTVIVESCEKNFMQHDAFSWGIRHGRLLTVDSRDPQAIKINSFINGWIEDVSQEERRVFVDDIFAALTADGALTVSDVMKNGIAGLENTLVKLIGSHKETRRTVAALPTQAALGSTLHHIRRMGLVRWLDECHVAKCLLLLAVGLFFIIASDKSLEITAMIFFVLLALAELVFTVYRLVKSKYDFRSVKERLYLLIILIAICAVVLIKENALFMIGSILYGIFAIVLSLRQLSKAVARKDDVFMRVVHAAEAVLLMIYGISSLVAPYDAIFGFALSIGVLLMLDGAVRLYYRIYLLFRPQKPLRRRDRRR